MGRANRAPRGIETTKILTIFITPNQENTCMINQFKYLFLVLVVVVLAACKVNQKTTVPRNLERIYDPASSSIHPTMNIYNTSDSTSLIVGRIFTRELLFNQANKENKLLARVKVIYNLYDLNNRQNLVDSATTTFKLSKENDALFYDLEIPVKAKQENKYILEVITTDLNRNSNQYAFFIVDRTNKHSTADYLIYNRLDDQLVAGLYINKPKQVKIKHYKDDPDSMFVFFFPDRFASAVVPYEKDTLIENFVTYDSTWVCYTDSVNYAEFSEEGVYYFSKYPQLDFSQSGFALFNFGHGYPMIKTPDDLAEPTIYLGGIDTIAGSDSTGNLTKLAVDNFWLSKENNIDKSRELLKVYYNRVVFANTYFTSYKEGWKTDRGMIYIIYGIPDYLFKSGDEERWIYNPNGIGPGIEFKFNRVEHPLTQNHYLLDREKLKTTGWDEAVGLWNTGEVFYYQN